MSSLSNSGKSTTSRQIKKNTNSILLIFKYNAEQHRRLWAKQREEDKQENVPPKKLDNSKLFIPNTGHHEKNLVPIPTLLVWVYVITYRNTAS